MKKSKKIFLLENNISKNYYKKNIYQKDKIKVDKFIKDIHSNLDNKKNNFHTLSKKFTLEFDKKNIKKFKKYKSVIVIGMGGSVLGAHAIYSFLNHKIKNFFLFIDNLDQLKIEKIKNKFNLKKSLFIIISKSGNTIETLINTNLFKDKINSNNTIIITEQKNNLLNSFAKNRKILHINHKNYIGGRYSILSEVGMVPAYFMDLEIKSFRENLLTFFETKKKRVLVESVVKLAHVYSLRKIKSIVLLNYAPQLNEFLYWCQQLIAESLGKKGKGILPLVSPAPKDHHSLMQLYLDGPRDKLFYIFSINLKKKMKINNNIFGKSFKFAENKELSKVVSSQKKALIKVLKKKNIPFREFKINEVNEKVLGELLSYFILETTLIGKLIGINPFDQPAVEEVKNLTKQYLS
ncbi:glucose-6-phosphate isomerase [Pelagibacteraceae bacterium]|nr:glucose-6-phosphate isomerase [Pelagibacteraceae bacterium]